MVFGEVFNVVKTLVVAWFAVEVQTVQTSHTATVRQLPRHRMMFACMSPHTKPDWAMQ